MEYDNGLKFQSWYDVTENMDETEISILASRGSDRPPLTEELRAELEELYPPEQWRGLWRHEVLGTQLFDHVVMREAAQGSYYPGDVLGAFGSKEDLIELRENAKTLLRRQRAASELGSLITQRRRRFIQRSSR